MTLNTRLTLVGAGPGDPELITLKGMKVLQTADVILYDALANEELLTYAPEGCLLIYVGKRSGLHQKQQIEINKMIVGYAKTMGHVVRLKGGDPFIFGRGHEEMEYAASHGIPSSYIPGISSAYAVPGLAGIPITKRLVNESFMVVTGTLRDGTVSEDISNSAKSNATVVILMGMGKLKQIVEIFKNERGEEEPIGLIQNGSLPSQRTLYGNLKNIEELQEKEEIQTPAIIIIGKVINEKLDTVNLSLREYAIV